MNHTRKIRVIISGGGTGGHVFPAISVANALRKAAPETEILFVGASGRLEMEKVPAAGYNIVGLPVSGFNRTNIFRNIRVIFRLVRSLCLAGKILRDFRPDVAVGVGGYASGPVLFRALTMGIPVLIQEQNSYAGITNRLLGRKASVICVAWDGMEKYFPASKIIKTGNPVRKELENPGDLRNEALGYFGLESGKPVVLVLGGSLGAGSINRCLSSNIEKIAASNASWIWQTGKYYFENINALVSVAGAGGVKVVPFIERMDYAYAAADIIISRAGAGTISELCLAGKPVVLVPSPNVAEDHQTKNAQALSSEGGAVLVRDEEMEKTLLPEVFSLIEDENKRRILSENIRKMAVRDSDMIIAQEILKLSER